jgi:hypothetical protein
MKKIAVFVAFFVVTVSAVAETIQVGASRNGLWCDLIRLRAAVKTQTGTALPYSAYEECKLMGFFKDSASLLSYTGDTLMYNTESGVLTFTGKVLTASCDVATNTLITTTDSPTYLAVANGVGCCDCNIETHETANTTDVSQIQNGSVVTEDTALTALQKEDMAKMEQVSVFFDTVAVYTKETDTVSSAQLSAKIREANTNLKKSGYVTLPLEQIMKLPTANSVLKGEQFTFNKDTLDIVIEKPKQYTKAFTIQKGHEQVFYLYFDGKLGTLIILYHTGKELYPGSAATKKEKKQMREVRNILVHYLKQKRPKHTAEPTSPLVLFCMEWNDCGL